MDQLFYLKRKNLSPSGEFSKESALLGPFKKNQIIQKVVNKEILPSESIFLKQDTRWIQINESEEFQEYFQAKPGQSPWTLLKKIQGEFTSTGPYTKGGLQLLLCKGIISDRDFVWTSSLPSWERISLCQQFYTRFDSKVEDQLDVLSMDYKQNTLPVTYYKRQPLPEPEINLDKMKWRE